MFSKLNSAQLQTKLAKLEQGQPAQDLQRLATLLKTLPDDPAEKSETRLRNFAQSLPVQAQPLPGEELPTISTSLIERTLTPNRPAKKRAKLARNLLLASLTLIVVMTTGLLLIIYLYTPTVGPTPATIKEISTSNNQQPYNDCLKKHSNPVDCLLYNGLDSVPGWVDLSQPLDLTRSANGYTMTLRRVYADTNNLIVSYELKGNHINALGSMVSMRFVLKDQTELVTVAGISSGVTVAPDWKGQVERRNIGDLKEKSSPLQLKIDVPFIQIQVNEGQAGPGDFINIPLNFSFDVTIPFYPGQELQLNQVVGGATLQRVVATPTEIRVYLDGIGEVAPDTFLSNNGQTDAYRGQLIHYQDTKASVGFVTNSVQTGTSQKWTLRVNPGPVQDWNPVTRFKQMLAGGPWTFGFETL